MNTVNITFSANASISQVIESELDAQELLTGLVSGKYFTTLGTEQIIYRFNANGVAIPVGKIIHQESDGEYFDFQLEEDN